LKLPRNYREIYFFQHQDILGTRNLKPGGDLCHAWHKPTRNARLRQDEPFNIDPIPFNEELGVGALSAKAIDSRLSRAFYIEEW